MKYSWDETVRVDEEACRDIIRYLGEVRDVREDPGFQKSDVDLVWQNKKIEIKGDRHYDTGNFFFETVSNNKKQTPGCFLYTECDLLFYYFTDERILYRLPMPETREWFLKNFQRFQEHKADSVYYCSYGYTVPRHIVLQEVPNVEWSYL